MEIPRAQASLQRALHVRRSLFTPFDPLSPTVGFRTSHLPNRHPSIETGLATRPRRVTRPKPSRSCPPPQSASRRHNFTRQTNHHTSRPARPQRSDSPPRSLPAPNPSYDLHIRPHPNLHLSRWPHYQHAHRLHCIFPQCWR